MELRRGMRVEGTYGTIRYQGTVYFVTEGAATIKRDDGMEGSGCSIRQSPYSGRHGWNVCKRADGNWCADNTNGSLKILDDSISTEEGLTLCSEMLWS